MVKNAIKDIFLIGVGAATLTKKKAEEKIKVFVKKGVLDNKQAMEVIDRVMRESNKVKAKLKKEGNREIGRVKKSVIKKGKRAIKKIDRAVKKTTRKIVKKSMRK